MPMANRTRLFVSPIFSRSCSGTEAWVMIAGQQAKLSTAPRDTANWKIFNPLRNFPEFSSPPYRQTVSTSQSQKCTAEHLQ